MAPNEPDLKRTLEALEMLADALAIPGIHAARAADELDDDEPKLESERPARA